jgi:hypothetical protein
MTRRNLIVGAVIFVAAAGFSGPLLSQTRSAKASPGSAAVHRRIEALSVQRRERVERQRAQEMKQAEQQAREQSWQQTFKEALDVTDAQWAIIMPKLKRVDDLKKETRSAVLIKNAQWVTTMETKRSAPGASTAGPSVPPAETTRHYEDWQWMKPWVRTTAQKAGDGASGVGWGFGFDETKLTRAQKACDELVALFDRADATDEQKVEKMNALRQARQDAARQLAQARRELREVLTVRQEATLFLLGLLD